MEIKDPDTVEISDSDQEGDDDEATNNASVSNEEK